MVKRIRTVNPWGLNKGFIPKFRESFWVRQKTNKERISRNVTIIDEDNSQS